VPLCELLIDAGAAREAEAILLWLRRQDYSFAAMKAPLARLETAGSEVPDRLLVRPTEPLRKVPPSVFTNRSPSEPPGRSALTDHLTDPLFDDQTESYGIDFQYVCPDSNRTEILSSLGGGVACLDLDEDLQVDLIFPQGGSSPESRQHGQDRHAVYRRHGHRFRSVTEAAGLLPGDYSQGTAVADCNNDGFDDVLITSFGINQLWLNAGDGTLWPGPEGMFGRTSEWSTSAAFADMDNDGDSDLYVVHYLDDLCPEVRVTDCGPRRLNAEQDRLYENLGDGTFREITQTSGIVAPNGKGLGIVAADFDRNGHVDLFVGNDSTENFLWVNRSDAQGIRFENTAAASGVAVGSAGTPQACMGIAAGDFDGNGLPDFFVSNFQYETNTLYSGLGGMQFVDVTRTSGLEAGSYALMGWGAQFLDIDDDVRPDLVLLNGLLDATPLPPQVCLQTDQGFADVSLRAGSWFRSLQAGRGLAVADLNNDAVGDLIATRRSGSPTLLQSRRSGEKQFSLMLAGRNCARDAIAARVTVTLDQTTVTRDVFGGGGYLCASQRRVFLPCRPDRTIDRLRIEWPDGQTSEWTHIPVARLMCAVQGASERSPQLVTLP
jgi:enediyne biosynthesis protein E4